MNLKKKDLKQNLKRILNSLNLRKKFYVPIVEEMPTTIQQGNTTSAQTVECRGENKMINMVVGFIISIPLVAFIIWLFVYKDRSKSTEHTFWDKVVGNDDWDKETGEYHGLER